ncbi:hypothetical protein M408DRAFT_229558 [Serendipita vermifera MAFF 305830]|uniref:Uncharacterized protein n=1 Tax=Serendipita vermifera MAFF 305830 TaxID=933852 RepID=A0A0C3AJN0_SERVB|nr:hypothetical protein M408DRAFT_229558 [Serendipita vermifera MAFF 305830]
MQIEAEQLIKTMPQITQDMEQYKVVSETSSASHAMKASSEDLADLRDTNSATVPPLSFDDEEGVTVVASTTPKSQNLVSLKSPTIPASLPIGQYLTSEIKSPSIRSLNTTISNQINVKSSSHDPYRPLISAILNVSENQPDAWVPFEAVRKVMGNVKAINKLGWATYTSMVKEAATKSIILLSEKDSGEKFIKLLPEPELAGATNAALIISKCPEEFRLLVATVLKLGSNDVDAKVPFTAVGDIVGKTKADVQALGYGWVSYPHWVQKAHESGWIQQGGFTEERWLMVGPKQETLVSVSTRFPTDLVAKTSPLSATEDLTGQLQTVVELPQLVDNIESVTLNAGTSKDQALSKEVDAPVPSTLSSATPFLQSEQSSTTGTSEPLERPLVSSSTSIIDHATIASRTKNIDIKGHIFGTNNSSSTSLMLSGSHLTRRVSADAYPLPYRRIVEAILTLCGGKTHIGITQRELFATLQGNESVGAIQQTFSALISKAVEESVLKRFMDDQNEVCFFLQNPVPMSTKKTSSKTWFPFMDFWR